MKPRPGALSPDHKCPNCQLSCWQAGGDRHDKTNVEKHKHSVRY